VLALCSMMSQKLHAGETGPWCRSLLHMMCGVHRAACLHKLPMHPASLASRALGAVAHSPTQLSGIAGQLAHHTAAGL